MSFKDENSYEHNISPLWPMTSTAFLQPGIFQNNPNSTPLHNSIFSDEGFESGASSERSSGLKRRKTADDGNYIKIDEEFTPEDSGNDHRHQSSNYEPFKLHKRLDHVSVIGPEFPRHHYGCEPPLPITTEVDAIFGLKTAHNRRNRNTISDDEDPYVYFELDDFNFYFPEESRQTGELATLDRLNNGRACSELYMSGILRCGEERRYVQDVLFSTLAIDGYGENAHLVSSLDVCIQSPRAERHDVWYRLNRSSSEYERFYKPFRWLVKFAKHFVGYLLETPNVTLSHFRSSFFDWLCAENKKSVTFQSWLSEANLQDFRTTVNANVGFLWKECHSIDQSGDDELCEHPLWEEIDPERLKAIPVQRNIEKNTVVTPFVYDCFKHMYFAKRLEQRSPDPAVRRKIRQRKKRLGLTPVGTLPITRSPKIRGHENAILDVEDVEIGDVVACRLEEGNWTSAGKVSYAYVKAKNDKDDGEITLDVLWLYHPADTTIGLAYYPFANELFLSDHCDCGEDALPLSAVIGTVPVVWSPQKPPISSLFVRQKFRTIHDDDTYDFTILCPSDFNYKCSGCSERTDVYDDCASKYKIGDTVLVRLDLGQDDCLRPAQIVEFAYKTRRIVLRRLASAQKIRNNLSKPNELVITTETFKTIAKNIIRRCNVRFFDQKDIDNKQIPAPYNRNGAGDFYYISQDQNVVKNIIDLATEGTKPRLVIGEPTFPPVRQGWNPKEPTSKPKLRGMGIFCGGGNFDRSFEDAGVVDFKSAVDWSLPALHSYRANCHKPQDTRFFCGSVNDHMAKVLSGETHGAILGPGKVDFIAGGSPCPGFSMSNANKLSFQSLSNASLVASVVTYVDVYNPLYLVLENVVGMARPIGGNGDVVFSQIIAALVGLGYQVQQFLVESWSFGSSQLRTRLFIVASAPGTVPMKAPALTHAHPPSMQTSGNWVRKKSLAKSGNGLEFGVRRDEYTPFPHKSVNEGIKDLPRTDNQVGLCPSFPDHRPISFAAAKCRTRIAMVPIRPQGRGLVQEYYDGKLSGEPLRYIEDCNPKRVTKISRMYSRVYGDGFFPTLVTAMSQFSSREGRVLHPTQNRVVTVMELRRQQDYCDEEVIVGNTRQQCKEIGNAVNRNSGLAIALPVRESWLQSNLYREEDDTDEVDGDDDINDLDDLEVVEVNEKDWKAARVAKFVMVNTPAERLPRESTSPESVRTENTQNTVSTSSGVEEDLAPNTLLAMAKYTPGPNETESGSESEWSDINTRSPQRPLLNRSLWPDNRGRPSRDFEPSDFK